MRMRCVVLGILTLIISTIVCSANELFVWPTCEEPQNIAPMQLAGGEVVAAVSSVAWNGKDYAIVWLDSADQRLHFRRFFADGTPVSGDSVPSTITCSNISSPKIVWNGSGYGVVWQGLGGLGYFQIYFLRLDAEGAALGSPVKVSFPGYAESAECYNPDLGWSGNGYCATWYDNRDGDYDIYATLLDSGGNVTYPEVPISTAPDTQADPRIVWSSGSGKYQAVWSDYRSGTNFQIYGSQVAQDGAVAATSLLVSGAGWSVSPKLADAGGFIGMVWDEDRDGNNEIYFARLSNFGNKMGTDLNVSSNGSISNSSDCVWTGAEFGVFWRDNSTGNNETWFRRISASGILQGSGIQVTYSGGMSYPCGAFAKNGYLVSGGVSGLANYVSAWGCAADNTPPSCPESPMAYSITGTTATVSWLPSVEDHTDIAYYLVYRNNSEIAKTSNNYFADSGLSLSTTYKYDVRAVNAAGLTTTGCPSASVYLKTNATLTLMLDKNDPNAHLYWNDEGMNFYNVYRGTSPHAMSLIGSTSELSHDDGNVLLDKVNYFYTVDDPGQ